MNVAFWVAVWLFPAVRRSGRRLLLVHVSAHTVQPCRRCACTLRTTIKGMRRMSRRSLACARGTARNRLHLTSTRHAASSAPPGKATELAGRARHPFQHPQLAFYATDHQSRAQLQRGFRRWPGSKLCQSNTANEAQGISTRLGFTSAPICLQKASRYCQLATLMALLGRCNQPSFWNPGKRQVTAVEWP